MAESKKTPSMEELVTLRQTLAQLSESSLQVQRTASSLYENNARAISLLSAPLMSAVAMRIALEGINQNLERVIQGHLKRFEQGATVYLNAGRAVAATVESILQGHAFYAKRLNELGVIANLKLDATVSLQIAALRGYYEVQRAGLEYATAGSVSTITTGVVERETALSGALALSTSESPSMAAEQRAAPVVATVEELLHTKLPKLRAGLLENWKGAREALQSNRPDRARHVAVSLRELLKGTVNHLADQAAYEGWVATQTDLKPKKKALHAKVIFLLRDTPAARAFMQTDAESVASVLEALSEKVHGEADCTDHELRYVFRRVEGIISAFLELRE